MNISCYSCFSLLHFAETRDKAEAEGPRGFAFEFLSQMTWVQVFTLQLTNCATFNKLFNLRVPQFIYASNGRTVAPSSWGCC